MNKNFKGLWISSEVWEMVEQGKISVTESALLGMILGLENGEGCFASIEYFAGKMNLGSRRIQKLLKSLRDKNLIEQISINGKRHVKTKNIDSIITENEANKSSPSEQKFGKKRTKVRTETNESSLSHYKEYNKDYRKDYSAENLGLSVEDDSPKNTEDDIDSKLANKFLSCLPVRLQKPKLKSNSKNHLTLMRDRDKISISEIKNVIKHLSNSEFYEDQFTPNASNLKTFRKNFHRIQKAIPRFKNQNKKKIEKQELDQIEVTPKAEKIVERLRMKRWTKNSSEALPKFVQLSLDNYEKTISRLHKLKSQEPEKNLDKKQKQNFQRRQRLLTHLCQSLPPSSHFIFTWFDNIWTRVHNWENWNGDLKPFSFSNDSKEFENIISDKVVSFCGDPSRTTKIISALKK
jgi:hypothetical protein